MIVYFVGCEMLEERHERHRGHQDSEEPPQLRQAGADRGLHPLEAKVRLHKL